MNIKLEVVNILETTVEEKHTFSGVTHVFRPDRPAIIHQRHKVPIICNVTFILFLKLLCYSIVLIIWITY